MKKLMTRSANGGTMKWKRREEDAVKRPLEVVREERRKEPDRVVEGQRRARSGRLPARPVWRRERSGTKWWLPLGEDAGERGVVEVSPREDTGRGSLGGGGLELRVMPNLEVRKSRKVRRNLNEWDLILRILT